MKTDFNFNFSFFGKNFVKRTSYLFFRFLLFSGGQENEIGFQFHFHWLKKSETHLQISVRKMRCRKFIFGNFGEPIFHTGKIILRQAILFPLYSTHSDFFRERKCEKIAQVVLGRIGSEKIKIGKGLLSEWKEYRGKGLYRRACDVMTAERRRIFLAKGGGEGFFGVWKTCLYDTPTAREKRENETFCRKK